MKESNFQYLFFETLDFTGNHTTSGYASDHTPFTFIPVFDTGSDAIVSDQNILWDFGDGNTSSSLTAIHYYKLPGWYTVRCFVLGREGVGYTNSFTQSIYVRNIIEDSLTFENVDSTNTILLTADSDKLEIPLVLKRTNSWQSYEKLSATGYSINFQISGSTAPILNPDEYDLDKYGHLKPYARILGPVYNEDTDKIEFIPISRILTNSTEIYAVWNNNQFVTNKITKDTPNSFFVGTSGTTTVYFLDDLFKEKDPEDDSYTQTMSSLIICGFDTDKFPDPDNKNIPQDIAVLNTIKSSAKVIKFFESIQPRSLSITSNGLDEGNIDNNGFIIRNETFNINRSKYTNTKIPFVIRAKDTFGSSCKFYPQFKYINNNFDLEEGEMYISVLDSNSNTVSSVEIYNNFGDLSSIEYGGFFKGYLKFNEPVRDVKIYSRIELPSISQRPSKINDFLVYHLNAPILYDLAFDKLGQTLNQKTLTFNANSIQSVCVIGNARGTTDFKFVDSELGLIGSYNLSLSTTNYKYISTFGIAESVPYHTASDPDKNMWITLVATNSTIRVDNDLNLTYTITPTMTSTGIITPVCVALDPLSCVWVTYEDTDNAPFIECYDVKTNTPILSGAYSLDPKYQLADFVIDSDRNIWIIGKDKTDTPDLLNKNDVLIRMTYSGSGSAYDIQYISLNGGSLWNLTLDVQENVYVTKDYDQVIKVLKSNNLFDVIYLNIPHIKNGYDTPLAGIACTLKSVILILDDYNNRIYYFNTRVNPDLIYSYNMSVSADGNLQAFGDWTGFKNFNTFLPRSTKNLNVIEGYSNIFTVDDETTAIDIRKKNENFDPILQYKSYLFQDYLIDNKNFNDDFMANIIGTLSSDPVILGKKIYEKISNYVDNIAYVDTCNINTLKSMYQMLGEEFWYFKTTDFDSPADLYRLIDLFSIKLSKLKGSRNKFAENLDDKGYDNISIRENGGTPEYGVNKGRKLDFFKTLLISGKLSKPIIAYERFSGNYTLVNTNLNESSYVTFEPYVISLAQHEFATQQMSDFILQENNVPIALEQIVDENSIDTDLYDRVYALSAYHPNWGWGLVLPKSGWTASDIPKYYDFYEYIEGFDNTQNEGVINWSDSFTKVDEDITKVNWDIVRQDLITRYLAKGLNLI
jgi:hypothetical protein